jgi:glycosyltransferase involved in cell wall biosynthesis
MHVLVIPSWYPENPGDLHGSFFREQAQAIAAAGHQVGILAVREIAIYDRASLRARRRSIDIEDDDGILTVRADVVLPIPKAHSVNYRSHFRTLKSAYSAYVAARGIPDVLHAHTVFPAGVLTERLSSDTGVPFIITEHRLSSMRLLDSPWYRRHGSTVVRSAKRRIAVALGMVSKLDAAYDTLDAPWQYIPGLLGKQFEEASVRPPAHRGPFVFGHVSLLDPIQKRVDLLIDAFADRFADDDGVILRIAGDSPARAGLESLTRARGIDQQVEFAGAVPRTSIVEEFSKYDAFAIPSSSEAFGTVIWEAMAVGLPIVSSNTLAGLNAVTDDIGIRFDVNDREQLGAALADMRKNIARYDSDHIRSVCIDHCGRDAFVSSYEKAYRGAIKSEHI